ncbi:MAG: segregation and condensation protein A, partial [Candidatus Kapaibacteriales bacterium]
MYKIILPCFEGPLDLLIYFIKRDQLDLFNIPISKITEEFLQYIKLLKSLDIEVTSEFLVMAATLMKIKSQMLLPSKEFNKNLEKTPDPRTELVEKIIEHEKINLISKSIAELIENHNYFFFKKINENLIKDISKKYI